MIHCGNTRQPGEEHFAVQVVAWHRPGDPLALGCFSLLMPGDNATEEAFATAKRRFDAQLRKVLADALREMNTHGSK